MGKAGSSHAVQSYVPLLWILKHPASHWELGLYPDDRSFEVSVGARPAALGVRGPTKAILEEK